VSSRRRRLSPSNRQIGLLFFAGVALVYISLSPLSIVGMGYLGEEVQACRQLLDTFWNPSAGPTPARPVSWPRNGAVGLMFQCPFIAASQALVGRSAYWEDRAMSVAPVLASALLVTVLFAWCSRLSGSRLWGFVLALIAGFCTMIWPYAYIGLETTQSLFLLLTAYIALESNAPRTWPRTLLFGLCAAVAVSARSDGTLLLPAISFLTWQYFRRESTEGGGSRRWAWKALTASSIVVLIFLANAHASALHFANWGGTLRYGRHWLSHDAISPLLHLIALFGSPNKGLIVYAPVALLALWSIPRAWTTNRAVVLFALLTVGGLAGGISLLDAWTDETWGPRYLHAAIAPLILCLAAAKRSRPWRLRTEVPLLAAGVFGFCVSLLGVLFYYGTLHVVASDTTPLTIQALQGDATWNHVRFNARLLDVWLRRNEAGESTPQFLERGRVWDARDRSRILDWKNVDLTTLAQPQPLLIHLWGHDVERPLQISCFSSLLAGAILLAWCAWACRAPLPEARGETRS
jgi:hypothetical protein